MKNRPVTCLSISQPFSELVVSGKKTLEVRTWNTKFRGTFFVHSPIKVRHFDCIRLKIDCGKLVTGAIVGHANLTDVIHYDSGAHLKKEYGRHFAAIKPGKNFYGFVLENPKKLRVPIPCKGALGFFRAEVPGFENSVRILKSQIMDEDFRYRWVGHH